MEAIEIDPSSFRANVPIFYLYQWLTKCFSLLLRVTRKAEKCFVKYV